MTRPGLVELVVAAEAAATAGARRDAVAAAAIDDVTAALHRAADTSHLVAFASGTGASPGVATGQLRTSADAVLDATDRGEVSVLVRPETTPIDEPGMAESVAVVTARGGLASHAAVMARAWGLPAVCGAEALRFGDGWIEAAGVRIHEGELITVDGVAGTVSLGGSIDATPGAAPPPELFTLLAWADEIRSGRPAVLANADTAADARRARELGAEGIGLCRTEHQFLGERAAIVARLVTDGDPTVLDELFESQRTDFEGLLDAMDGLVVTVRLLDAPLHEFLAGSSEAQRAAWVENDPMLGLRGVRLALMRPGLYETQVRALAEAVAARRRAGGDPRVEVMVPLVAAAEELRLVRAAIDGAWRSVLDEPLAVGTMIETPRAALVAADLAEHADFFSFGTNDLTQLVYGLGRDDTEARVVRPYLKAGVLPADPFTRLDPDGVGALMATAIAAGRARRPQLGIGVCGEQAGDPESVALLAALGVDRVSVSPYRVPVARLAAAQTVLAGP